MCYGDLPFYECRLYETGWMLPPSQRAYVKDYILSSETWEEPLFVQKEVINLLGDGTIHSSKTGADVSQPMFRNEFIAGDNILRARLYATARGIYECWINGAKVSDEFFAPGWQDYRFQQPYNVYDITDKLREGGNAIGFQIASGWWNDFMGYQLYWQDQYGLKNALKCMLVIDYANGTHQIVSTDENWKVYDCGPLKFASMQNGEEYDFGAVPTGWCEHGFPNSGWYCATVLHTDNDTPLHAYLGTPMSAHETLQAKSVKKIAPEAYIYDLGQNIAGVPRISLTGVRNKTITLRYAETLWPDSIPEHPVAPYTSEIYVQNRGKMYTDNLRSALNTDRYHLSDTGNHVIEPRFTMHGFRYVQIEGEEYPLPLECVEGLVIHSLDSEQTASFETDNIAVNRLFENIIWSQKGNFLAVPTDCPQRDERLGYTGDGQIFARSATYNFNVNPFFNRWLYAIRDNQDDSGNFPDYAPKVGTPPAGERGGGVLGWSDAGIIMPWTLYIQYGDLEALRHNYPAMKKYMDYLENRTENNLQPADGLGDWLGKEITNSQIINNAYYAYDAILMAKIAGVLGHDDDRMHYLNLHSAVKKAFNKTFVNADGRTFTPRGFLKGQWIKKPIECDEIEDTQSSYLLPLKANLFESPHVAMNHLLNAIERNGNSLATGFIGTPALLPLLTETGYGETAWEIFLNEECPSWLYPVSQGATTIWERWDSYTRENGFGPVDMNSFNHYSYGAVEEWMMKYALGIETSEQNPGYKEILLNPSFSDRVGYVSGYFDSPYGRITASWRNMSEGFSYSVEIPANTTALFTYKGNCKIIAGLEGVAEKNRNCIRLKSGKYKFVITK